MSRKTSAQMPDEIRHQLRAKQHPARTVECPHCGAGEHRPCRSQSKIRTLPQPHPSRITTWARATAVCPDCQVEPAIACHNNGREMTVVHPQRETEARRWAA